MYGPLVRIQSGTQMYKLIVVVGWSAKSTVLVRFQPYTQTNTSVAQLVEHWSPKLGVVGSSPASRAKIPL